MEQNSKDSEKNIDPQKLSNDTKDIFNLAPIAIIIFNKGGKIIDSNVQANLLLGFGSPENSIIGTNLLEDDPYRKSGMSDLIRKALQGEEIRGEDIKLIHPKGKVSYLNMKLRPVSGKNGEPRVLGIIEDVSQRIRLQNQLERSYQVLTETFHELQRIDKMKTNFIDVVSHELRTPLTVMRGYLDMITSQSFDDLDSKLIQKIENIRMNTEKLSELVDSMLDVARLEKGTMEVSKQEASAKAVIEEVIAAQRSVAEEKRQELTMVTVGEVSPVKMDARKMREAIKNLINNAIKYTPEKGRIEIGLADEGKMLHIWVKDNGVGIELEDMNRIFERFYIVTADNLTYQVDRMGLGLPIAKGIVESHGGKIWFESEIGKGSIFHINIPKE